MTFTVYPHRDNAYGNIIWADRNHGSAYYRVSQFAMRNGKFPPTHPVAPNSDGRDGSQMGDSAGLRAFRERGYWASCFPEGDGITWKPLNGQSDEQCLVDIRECFGWDANWHKEMA
jgi:hypothetical protein